MEPLYTILDLAKFSSSPPITKSSPLGRVMAPQSVWGQGKLPIWTQEEVDGEKAWIEEKTLPGYG